MPAKPKRPTPTPPPTAAEDHLARLIDLRNRLTGELNESPPAYVAGIGRQLQAVLREIANLAPPPADSVVDRLRARRAQKEAEWAARAAEGTAG